MANDLIVTTRQRLITRLIQLTIASYAGFCTHIVYAGPNGENIVGGIGEVVRPSADLTQINQSSNRLAIDWNRFDIANGETVRFVQPNQSAIALNRIFDSKASEILGSLQANGQVFLINPRGIIFGQNAVVQVGGLLATDLMLDPADFMNGSINLNDVPGLQGSIQNQGLITAASGGSVALLGHVVENSGDIVAPDGKVILASANSAIISFDDNSQLGVAIDDAVLENLTGNTVEGKSTAITNSGKISAEGGQVLISAKAGADVFTQAVNNTGIIEATSVRQRNGVIEIIADGDVNLQGTLDVSSGNVSSGDAATSAGRVSVQAKNITHNGSIKADSQTGNGGQIELFADDTVIVKGDANISARSDNAKGGAVHIVGERTGILDRTAIDVSGDKGGGEILIGGDFQGAAIDGNRIGTRTVVSRDAEIKADAITEGDGGKVIVWADADTFYKGSIFVRGGALSGDGGFVEVSGKKTLGFDGYVNTSAMHGDVGNVLLDPDNIIIADGATGVPADDLLLTTDNQILAGEGGATVTISQNTLQNIDANVLLQATDTIIVNDLTDNVLNLNAANTAARNVTFELLSNNDNAEIKMLGANDRIDFNGGGTLSFLITQSSSLKYNNVLLKDINMKQGGNLTISVVDNQSAGPNWATEPTTITTGNITYSPTYGGNVSITGSSAVVGNEVGGVNITTGNISIAADGDVAITATSTSTTDQSGGAAINVGNIAIGGSNVLNDVTITSTMSEGVNTSSVASVAVGDVSINGASTAGIAITANNTTDVTNDSITLNGTNYLTKGGIITATAQNILLNNNVVINTNNGGGTGADITLTAGTVNAQNNDLTLNVGSGNFGVNFSNISNMDALTLITSKNISIGDVDVGGGEYFDQTEINVLDNATSLTLQSDGDINVSTTSIASGAVTLRADQDDNNAGTLTVSASKTLTKSSAGTLTLDGYNVAIDGTVTRSVAGNVDLLPENLLTMGAAGSLASNGGNITLGAATITMTDGATINSGAGTIAVTAANNATISGLTSTNNTTSAVTVTSTAGSILDAGDTNTDITATNASARVNLNGATGVGAFADPLSLNATAAQVSATTGDIAFSNTGAMTLNTITANAGGINISSSGNMTVSGAITATGAGKDVSLTSTGGTFTANAAITSGAGGDITLASTLGNSAINTAVDSNGGLLTITAGDDLSFDASSNLQSDNGNIVLTANTDADTDGGITFNSASVTNAGTGTIALTAYENISFTGLTTTNATNSAVSITSTNGALIDAGDTNTDITAINGRAVLNAQTAIGSANALDLAVNELDITSDAGGILNVINNRALSVIQAISNGVGGAIDVIVNNDASLTVAGNVTSNSGAINLRADDDVSVNAAVAIASANGNVTLRADNDNDLNGSGGAINLNATSTLNVGTGTITLQADESIAVSGLTTTNATASAVTVTSTSGAITDGGTTDITAVNGGVVLNSQTGIGSANALELAVAQLDATNDTSSAISVTNNQALSVIRANSAGGAINIATSSGNLTIENTAGGGLGVNSSNGAITLNSAAGLTVEDNVTALVNAGSGTIAVTAANNIALTGLTTTNATSTAVSVTSTNGLISDGGDTVADITAINGRAVLNAQTTIGSGNPLDLAVNQLDITSDAGGVLNIINNRALSVIQAISNGVGGAIDIIVNNDASLTIAGTVDSNSGAINLRADDDVNVNAAVAINSDNGNVTLRADNDSDVNGTGGAVNLNATSTLNVGSGMITIQADESIAVAGLTTTNATSSAVTITSTSGAITDGGTTDISAVNGRVVLNSQTGIGSGDALELAVAEIDATNDASAAINLTNNQTISIIRAASLGGAIDLATSAGNIIIENAAGTGLGIASSNGAIGVNSAGTLTVEDNATALINAGSGTINLTALNAIALTGLTTTNATTSAVTVTSTNGAITDGGNTSTDISAVNGRAVLVAKTGIGVAGAGALDVNLNSFSATNSVLNSTGGIFINAAGDLNVVQADANTSGAASDGITISSQGNLTLSGLIVANIGGSGNQIALQSSDDMTFANTSSVVSADGAIVITADTNTNANGGITMIDGATINSGLNTLTMTAAETIALSGLTSTNISTSAVTVTSTAGAITDAGDSVADITATALGARVNLNAATGIGNGNAIDTTIDTLAAANSGANGITVIDSDGLILNTVNANAGNVAITAVGLTLSGLVSGATVNLNAGSAAISDGNVADNNIVATDLILLASTGIGFGDAIEIDADTLTATNSGANGITVTDSDNLSLNNIDAAADNIAITANGLTLNTSTNGVIGAIVNLNAGTGAITDARASAGNDITATDLILTATTGIGNGDAIEIDANTLTATNSGANGITVTDSDNLSLNNIGAAAGNIAITAVGLALNTSTNGVQGATVNLNAGTGAITDSRASAGNDITATDLTLTATSGIGSGNTLEIDTDNLTATNSAANGITLTDSDGVVIVGATSNAGAIAVTSSTGNLSTSGAITTTGAITLIATTGNATINSLLDSNGSALTLTSGDDLALGASANLQSDNGNILLTANAAPDNVDNNGGITFNAASVVNAGSGSITLTGYETISLTGLTTTGSATITSSNGAITDAGDTATDVTAASLTLSAATGIGVATTAPLEFSVTTLNATTTSGDIAYSNSGDITLGATSTTNGAIDITASGNLTAGAAVTTTGLNKGVKLTSATGNLQVNGAVTAGTNGAILLESTLGNSTINSTLDSNGGTLTLTAGDDIALGATANLQSDNGAINLTANAAPDNVDNNGGITFNAASLVNAGSGAITLNGYETISVTGLTTTGSVSVTSTNAAITDAGNTNTDIIATDLILTATTGIGLGDALEIDANTLTASNSGANGITITDSDDLALNNINAAAGNMAITANGLTLATSANGVQGATVNLNAGTGAITDTRASAGNDITATDLIVTATSGIGSADTLEIDADTLTATNSISAIRLTDSDDLALNLIDNNTRAVILSAGGALTDNNVGTNNIIAGALTLTASSGIGSGNAIEIDADSLTATNTGANGITLTDSDDLALNLIFASTSAVTLSSGGALTDNNAGANNINTQDLILIATTGIGSGNALEISVNTLAATNTGAGGIAITEVADDLALNLIDANSGTVILDSVGALTDNNAVANNIVAGVLTLAAVDGIGAGNAIEIDADQLTATDTGANGITITDSDDLSLNNIDATTGNVAITTVGLTLNGLITGATVNLNSGTVAIADGNGVSNNIAATDLILAATTGIGAGDALEIDTDNVTATNSGANGITLTDSDDVVIVGATSSSGAIAITSSTGNLSTSGAVTTTGAITLAAITGNATINSLLDTNGSALGVTAGDDLALGASANLQSDNGAIAVTANTDADTDGGIVMTDGAQINSTTGTLTLSAYESIALTGLTSTNTSNSAITVTTTNGAITDAGDSNTDISATAVGSRVNLNAATGIGAFANPLELNVLNLAATTTSGDLGFTNTGVLTLDGITTNNGAINIGTSGDLTVASGGVTATGASNGVSLTSSGGNFVANGAITAGSNGIILLDATTGNNTINATVDSNGGALTVSAGDDIALGASANLQSDNGAINFTANAAPDNVDNNGGITFDAASLVNAGSGAITLNGYETISLTGLTTTGSVSITSTNAAITDAGNTNTDIIANGLTLNAVTGIGSGDALEIDADTLTATNSGANGITVTDSDNLSLNNIDAAADDVTIAANGLTLNTSTNGVIGATVTLNAGTGAITDARASAGNDITATDLTLTAATGIGSGNTIEIDADTLTATNSGANGIAVTDSDGLILNVTNANAGNVAITAVGLALNGLVTGATVNLNAGTDALSDGNGVSNNINATDLILSATTGIGSGNAIEIDTDTLTATNSGANGITITDSDNLSLNNIDAAAGNIAITADGLTLNTSTNGVIGATVNLNAGTGAITDARASAGNDITATDLTLTATTGIGSGDAIEIDANTLTATNSGANGITVTDSDSLILNAINAVAGNIAIIANGLTLNGLLTGATVNLNAGTGAISDSNGAANNVAATDLLLTAATGIGSGDEIEIDSNTLTASNSGANGIAVTDSDDLSLNNINAAAGNVAITANGLTLATSTNGVQGAIVNLNAGTGAITDARASAGNDITATDLILTATTGIGLGDAIEIDANTLTATNTANATQLIDSDELTINGANGGSGILNITAAGNIALTAVTTTNATINAVTITSTGGSITDAGGTTDITATAVGSRVNLNAATGIGTFANPLELDILNLAATTTSGDLAFSNPGALTLDGVTTNNGAINISAGGDLTVASGGVTATGANNGVSLSSSGGNVVANGAVTSGTNGIILLDATIGNNTINATLDSNGGALTVSAGDDIALGATANLQSDNGAINFTANAAPDNVDNNGGITFDAASLVNAGSGAITLNGYETISLTGLTTTGSVSITSTNAAITDAGNTNTDIIANGLTLNAVTGIGSGDALEIDADTLTASNSGANGITITDSDDLALNNINAAAGNVAITANGLTLATSTNGVQGATVNLNAGTGAITDARASAGNDITATDLILTATTGIGLGDAVEIDANTLTATNSGANGITVIDSDALSLNNIDAAAGDIAITAVGLTLATSTNGVQGAIVNLNAGTGAITDSRVSAGNDITATDLILTATTGIGLGDAIEIDANTLTASNSGANGITITDSDDLALNNINAAAGNIAITANGLTLATSTNGVQGATVNLNAGTGAITDSRTSAGNDITATDLILTAATGIGNGDAIEIDTNTLAISNTTNATQLIDSDELAINGANSGSGIVAITAAGNITLTAVTTTNTTINAVTITSTGGSITDSGGTADITATAVGSQVNLSAFTGIGTFANPLELDVLNLVATTTSGDLAFSNPGALTLDGLATNNGGINISAGGDLTVGSGGVTATGANNGVSLTSSGGNLATNGAVTSGVNGVVILASTNGNNTINSTIDSNGGALAVTAGDDLVFAANANFQSDNGNMIFTADTDADTNGGIVFNSAAVANAGSGTITLTANEDVVLTGLTTNSAANNAVVVTSTNGAITDAGNTSTDISAINGRAILNSQTGIGFGGELELSVAQLDATNDAGGVINIFNDRALNLIQAVSNSVGGAIDIIVGNNAALTIAGAVTSNGGAINLRADDDLLINSAVAINSNGGAINLIADNDGSPSGSGGAINFAAGSSLQAGGGDVVASADELIQMATLNGVDDLSLSSALNRFAGVATVNTLTATGDVEIAANLTTLVGGMNFTNLIFSNTATLNSAAQLQATSLQLTNSGLAILQSGADANVTLGSIAGSGQSLQINSAADISLGASNLAAGDITLTADTNNNQASVITLTTLDASDVVIQGSAALDDQLIDTSNTINAQSFVAQQLNVADLRVINSITTLSVEANTINLSNNLSSGSVMSLTGDNINLLNSVLLATTYNSAGARMSLRGALNGNGKNLQLNAGNDVICCDQLTINNVDQLAVINSARTVFGAVSTLGNIEVNASRQIYLNDNMFSAGNIVLNANSDLDGSGIVGLLQGKTVTASGLITASPGSLQTLLEIASCDLNTIPDVFQPVIPQPIPEVENPLDAIGPQEFLSSQRAADSTSSRAPLVSYLNMGCNTESDDDSRRKECKDESSMMDFLGTFLIDNQLPSR